MSDLLKEIEADMERGHGEEHVPTLTPTERGLRDYKPTDRPLYMPDQPFHAPKPLKPLKPAGVGTQPKPYVAANTYFPRTDHVPDKFHLARGLTADFGAQRAAAAEYDAQLAAAEELAKFEAIPDPNEVYAREVEERIRAEKYGPQVSMGKYEDD